MRLLLVEDDEFLGYALRDALKSESYRVDWVKRGDDLIAFLAAEQFDLILLDLSLPHMSGLEALAVIRDHQDKTPIIIITASDRPGQKVLALNAGADDFLVKPLDLDELLAVIRVHIRRRDGRLSEILAVGQLRLDLMGRTAQKEGQFVPITAKEYNILAMLMRRAGRYVSKNELEAELYDEEVQIQSNTIEVAISSLRRKFGATVVLTARGLGYMIPK